jgi:hypothetical protein
MSRRFALVLCLLAAIAGSVQGQDTTVIVIDPNAPAVPVRVSTGPPIDIVREAVARYNDSTVSQFFGSFTVASGTAIEGDVVMYRGTLRVIGRITGRVTIINGNIVLGPLGTVTGDILVLGGRSQVAPSARHTGTLRVFGDPAPVSRTPSGKLEIRERPQTLGELAAARASFQAGRLKATISLETGQTYNRVEGLPILVGPTFTVPTPNQGEFRADLWGLLRTEKDETDQLPALGWRTRFEWESKAQVSGGVGLRWESVLQSIDSRQLTHDELGWSSFFFHRDYDDYFESNGIEGYAYYRPVPSVRLLGSARYDRQRTVPASDPISVFRNDEPWRPNTLIDDGHFISLRFQVDIDSRNSTRTPTAGWLVNAWLEHSSSDDVAPIALPSELRSPIPTFRGYGFNHVGFDIRHYSRINQLSRVNLRVAGGGWLSGDPLPIQRRLALGGPGLLPGHAFRSQTCAPASFSDPAQSGFCDRFLAIQGELRIRVPLSLRDVIGAQEWYLVDRLFGGDLADIVIFGDAGKAWLTGEGPSRVPNNRIPVFGEWDYDVGAGLDIGGLAIFVAKSVSTDDAPRFILRLQRRF